MLTIILKIFPSPNITPETDLTLLSLPDLAEKIASKSSIVLKIGKKAFYEQAQLNLEEAYEYTSMVMVENMMKDDAVEGINSFLEKRKPKWSDK